MHRSAPAVLALGLMVAVAGCGDEEAEPVKVARQFVSAAKRRDPQTILPLLESKVHDRLATAAERAADQVGGRRTVESHEMFQVVDVDPTFQIASAELVHNEGDTAQVRLVGADGNPIVLNLVREQGSWRVQIPLPGDASSDPGQTQPNRD